MLLAFALMLGMQILDPTLEAWTTAVADATMTGDMQATVGRLEGTEDRVVLCTLDGAVTRLRCFHSTQRMVNGVEVATHSEPGEYAGESLADILAAERAWADGP